MRYWLTLILLLPALLASAERGDIISTEFIRSYSIEDLEEIWKKNKIPKRVMGIKNEFDVYELVYETIWHDGTPINASGYYLSPKNTEKLTPELIFQHGTRIKVEQSPKIQSEMLIAAIFASNGYATYFPHYLGLGKGDKFHLYQHALTEASASIDMLRACRNFNKEKNIEVDQSRVFITGYSQGGHAAMATHWEIEKNYKDEINVAASAPMSGAYDMAGAQTEAMVVEYTHPGYLPYMFIGYNEVYGMYDDIWSVFKEPYKTTIPPLFNGKNNFDYINEQLPAIPRDMVKDEIAEAYFNDPNHPFKKALEENATYDWKPEEPMLICYCTADEQVYYKNALVAHEKMKENGSKFVKLRNSGKSFGHFDCAVFSMAYTKYFFDSVWKGSKKGRKGPFFKRFILSLGKIILRRANKKKNTDKKIGK